MSITAITPASTGSLTTTSAASGTEPAMLVQRTRIPASRISRTALLMSPPMIERPRNFELDLRHGSSPRPTGHVADVGVVPEDDLGDPVQHPRLVAAFDQETDRISHGRER